MAITLLVYADEIYPYYGVEVIRPDDPRKDENTITVTEDEYRELVAANEVWRKWQLRLSGHDNAGG